MKLSDFDYELPSELIAQTPIKTRDQSRLMVIDKKTGEYTHKHFYDIINELHKGDVLVLNDTKVIPARLIGTKEETGAVIELLLLKDLGNNIWECLTRPAKRIKEGTIVSFGEGKLKAVCIEVLDEGIRKFKLEYKGILYENIRNTRKLAREVGLEKHTVWKLFNEKCNLEKYDFKIIKKHCDDV